MIGTYQNFVYYILTEAVNILIHNISHFRKANCYDNACCENFFSHLKSESLELSIPIDEDNLIKQTKEFII